MRPFDESHNQTLTMGVEHYFEDRVEGQLADYFRAAAAAKRKYKWMQSLVIILGVSIPVTVNLIG